HFWRIWSANERGVVAVERHLADIPPLRLGRDRIDDADAIGTGDLQALLALHAVADNEDLETHSNFAKRSKLSSFSWTSEVWTGMLPSCSHSIAAASDPSTEAMTLLPVENSDSAA